MGIGRRYLREDALMMKPVTLLAKIPNGADTGRRGTDASGEGWRLHAAGSRSKRHALPIQINP
jgi:hypothetical protein